MLQSGKVVGKWKRRIERRQKRLDTLFAKGSRLVNREDSIAMHYFI